MMILSMPYMQADAGEVSGWLPARTMDIIGGDCQETLEQGGFRFFFGNFRTVTTTVPFFETSHIKLAPIALMQ